MENKGFIIEQDGKQFVDVVKLLPDRTSDIREIVKEIVGDKVTIHSRIRAKSKGSGSKKVTISRFIELDQLFFEGLGLWQGEGAKSIGIYFGNTCVEVLQRFIEFVEKKLGILREEFKVNIVVPKIKKPEECIKKRWSDILKIRLDNFRKVLIKSNTNLEYCYLQFNSIILIELMKLLHERLKSTILENEKFAASYMRSIIAGEGQVATKSWGTLFYVSISSKYLKEVEFYKQCLKFLGITSGAFESHAMKFPIYGKDNFDKMNRFRLLDLHPNKKLKFDNGIKSYRRIISDSKEVEKLILQQLTVPKTYDELALSLGKSRSTIQSFYIPKLEKKGLIRRVGKRRQAWLFQVN